MHQQPDTKQYSPTIAISRKAETTTQFNTQQESVIIMEATPNTMSTVNTLENCTKGLNMLQTKPYQEHVVAY